MMKVVYTIDQSIEGLLEDHIYLKISPSSYKNSHYIITEDHKTDKWSCELVSEKHLNEFLQKLKVKGMINEVDILNYFYDLKNAVNPSDPPTG